jgi:tripartite ATP-independent transporter DctM subunit
MSSITIGILGFILLMVLFALRMPVAFAMALVGFIGFGYLVSMHAGFTVVAMQITSVFTNYFYASAIMFIWMGYLAYHVGISQNLYAAMYKQVGHIRGGLAMASIAASSVFGAICGSILAATATMGAVSIPEMRKYNYADSLATASAALGGILGITIPPSITLIVYGIMAEESIGKLFVGVIFPGILLMVLCMLTVYILVLRDASLGPAGPRANFKERIRAIFRGGTAETLAVFCVVLGGMFAGWFTPTEAGAVGTASIMLVGSARRRLSWRAITISIAETTKTSAMVFLLVVGAEIFGSFMAVSRIPSELASWAGQLPLPSIFVMVIILFIMAFLGCIMDGIAAMLLSLPVVLPAVVALGYDTVWFGVLMVIMVGLGSLTPPVGLSVFIISGIAKDVPLATIFRGVMPFVGAILICVAILLAFPQIALFLPSLMK